MKRIKLSVAALSIALNGFCTNPSTEIELIRDISITTEDMIQSMRIINTNDSVITKEISEMYIHNLLDVLSKLEDLHAQNMWRNCENCDEID